MTVEQLELAFRVRVIVERTVASENTTLEKVLMELGNEFEISDSQLKKFLDGDPIRLVKKCYLNQISDKLGEWLLEQGHEGTSQGQTNTDPETWQELSAKRP